MPTAPSEFFTNAQSNTSITFAWSEPNNGGLTITDYEIDWNQGDSINKYTSLAATTSGARSKTVSGLTVNGEVYRFIVRAKNSLGKSANSTPYSVLAATVPSAPSGFVRNNFLTTKTQVAFSWTVPSSNGGTPVLDYTVEMDENNDGVYSVVATGY